MNFFLELHRSRLLEQSENKGQILVNLLKYIRLFASPLSGPIPHLIPFICQSPSQDVAR